MLINNEKSKKTHTTGWSDLLSYVIRGNEKKFIFALLLGLLSNAFFSISNPLALKYLFDEGIIRGDFRTFAAVGILFVLAFTFWRIWVYCTRMYVQKIKILVTKKLCFELLNKYYRMPYDEIIKRDQGYFVSRVYDEVVSTAPPTIDSFLSFANVLITLVIAVGITLSISWRASITIAFAIPLIFLISRRFGSKIKNQTKVEKEEEANLRGLLIRSITSYKFTNIFGLKAKVFEKFEDSFNVYAEAFISRFRSSARYETFSNTLMSYAETLAIIGAGYEILVGRMSFGGYMAFMAAYWQVLGSVRSLFSLVPELSRLCGSVERLKEFGEIDSILKNLMRSNTVSLKQVEFGYDEKIVISTTNLNFEFGEKVLIVGPNGSGKSTLAHLISGLLSPSSGNLTTLALSKISAVIYPSDFIPGSVRDNLSFAVSEDEKNRFEYLSRQFSLDHHLDKDPSELSAGQRKKLEIMMGLVKESDVYVFDEPLAGIDISSKETVMNEIFKYTDGRILIVIMHGDEHFHRFFDRKIDLGETKLALAQLHKNDLKNDLMITRQAAEEFITP